MSEPEDDWIRQTVITVDPKKMGGAPIIRTHRFPLASIWDCVRAGESIEAVLEHFPQLNRDDIIVSMKILETAEHFIANHKGREAGSHGDPDDHSV